MTEQSDSEYPAIKGCSAGIVANSFLALSLQSRIPVSPLKLIKLVYMAYAWWLAVRRERLFDEPIEAWDYGPVIPSLYHEFKRYGRTPITEMSNQFEFSDNVQADASSYDKEYGMCIPIPGPDVSKEKLAELEKAMKWVWKTYVPYTAVELSRMTHQAGSPWDEAREDQRKHLRDDDIHRHFRKILQKGRFAP